MSPTYVLHRQILVCEKNNQSLLFSGTRKVQWETGQAEGQAWFSTGAVSWGFSVPTDGFYLSPISNSCLT